MAEDETVLFGSLEECIKSLRDHEMQTNTRYAVGYSSKGFGKRSTGSNIVNNKRVQWLNGKPFISLGLKVYFCHHGKNYRPNNNARTPKEHGYSKGGRVRAQQTKKLGCPAKVLIKEGVMLPASHKFLFVYQSFGMKTLLERYGNTMTLLDATYRTTKYHLPLFFLVVKTNVDYQVVACFIPEEENSVSEQEALQIIKDHNPNWSPKHFMTDMDEREMHAMRSLFPEAAGLLCDFHRAQSWSRWIKKNKVGQKGAVFNQLQKLASSPTEADFDVALDALQHSDVWPVIGQYMTKIWLSCKQKWAHCFRAKSMTINVNTNNGVERIHRTFKQCYLNGKTTLSLSAMVAKLLTGFSPDKLKRYKEENMMMTGRVKKMNTSIPNFLHGRPKTFMKHCIEKIELSKDCPYVKSLNADNDAHSNFII